ncbi:MAG TPA: hypothetical protein VKY74_14680 [Chloroflexia bacterium]|nr:hypothetical protein [Chloroflexia bacterium]
MEPDAEKGGRKEVKLMLDGDVAGILMRLAGSPRKQSEYISRLLRAASDAQDALAQVEQAELVEIREILRGVLVELADLRARLPRP